MVVRGGIAKGLILGNLGFKIKGIQNVDNRDGYFSDILSRYKAIGFIGLRPTVDQHAQLLKDLFKGDSDCVAGLIKQQNHPTVKAVEDWDKRDYFVHQNWHVDFAHLEYPKSLLSMHMTTFTCPKDRGQTHLVSLIDLYESLPTHLQEHLQTAKFEHHIGSESAQHSALRTHPITGETSLYWSSGGTELVGPHDGWFDELKAFVNNYLLNKSNWWSWEWSEGDVLVWDNRCLLHSFSPGWSRDQRVFDRVVIGDEKPFYQTDMLPKTNPDFGDSYYSPYRNIGPDVSKGPNPDHIPLVFTRGIYALKGLEDCYQKVTLLTTSYDVSETFTSFIELFNNENDFVVRTILPENNDIYKHLHRYASKFFNSDLSPDQIFVVSRNGDLMRGLLMSEDLFTDVRKEQDIPTPIELIRGLLSIHPDMRHSGHAWHYPDWFPHQPLQERPWSYHNLSFAKYNHSPSEDFLVQFAIDTVYGCFNHLKTDEERKRIVDRIHDYLSYMMDLEEYKHDR